MALASSLTFRLLFTLAVLLAGQANAVDYQRCEAIQQAYGRMARQQQQAGLDAFDSKLRELCPAEMADRSACQVKSETFKAAAAARDQARMSFQSRLDKIKEDYKKADCP